jgi:hypothetical protein
VVEENHSYGEILGSTGNGDPYIRSLAAGGLSFTNSHAVAHPSEPNYLALFSGSTQNVTDDTTPPPLGGDNLAHQLLAQGLTFGGYSEDLPSTGYLGDIYANYARKHNPWSDFTNVPASLNQPFSAFPSDFTQLPAVSFVVPNLQHDMHDGTVAQGDQWLQANMSAYARWTAAHNSLLIVTWDEDDGSASNHIPTIVIGAGIKPAKPSKSVNHYSLLRAIEAVYALPPLGGAASANPLF